MLGASVQSYSVVRLPQSQKNVGRHRSVGDSGMSNEVGSSRPDRLSRRFTRMTQSFSVHLCLVLADSVVSQPGLWMVLANLNQMCSNQDGLPWLVWTQEGVGFVQAGQMQVSKSVSQVYTAAWVGKFQAGLATMQLL